MPLPDGEGARDVRRRRRQRGAAGRRQGGGGRRDVRPQAARRRRYALLVQLRPRRAGQLPRLQRRTTTKRRFHEGGSIFMRVMNNSHEILYFREGGPKTLTKSYFCEGIYGPPRK